MRDYLKNMIFLSLSLSLVFPITVFGKEKEVIVELQTHYQNGDVLVGEFTVYTDMIKIEKNKMLDWSIKNSSNNRIVFEREMSGKSPLENSSEVNLLTSKDVEVIQTQLVKMKEHIHTFLQIEPAKKKVETKEKVDPLEKRAYSAIE